MESKGNTQVHAKVILIAGVGETHNLHIPRGLHGPES